MNYRHARSVDSDDGNLQEVLDDLQNKILELKNTVSGFDDEIDDICIIKRDIKMLRERSETERMKLRCLMTALCDGAVFSFSEEGKFQALVSENGKFVECFGSSQLELSWS